MDSIQKFYADVERIKKHDRAEHSQYSGDRVCQQVAAAFVQAARDAPALAQDVAAYWQSACVQHGSQEEPGAAAVDKLAAMLSLLSGGTEQADALVPADWRALCRLTTARANDLPLELLNHLMAVFVDRQALA